MRIYDEDIAVWFDQEPRRFVWRAHLLTVTQVHTRWLHSEPWWGPELTRATQRETWRVVATRGQTSGVYELTRIPETQHWQLHAVVD